MHLILKVKKKLEKKMRRNNKDLKINFITRNQTSDAKNKQTMIILKVFQSKKRKKKALYVKCL